MYKEKIYQAMDSFLTESTDLKEKPIIRSVETLNKDRHLFVEKMEEIIQEVEQRILEEVDLTRDDDSCECDNCHRIRRYLKNPKREMNSIMQKVAHKVEQNSLKNFVERLRGDLMLHPDLENLNEIITKRLDKIIKN